MSLERLPTLSNPCLVDGRGTHTEAAREGCVTPSSVWRGSYLSDRFKAQLRVGALLTQRFGAVRSLVRDVLQLRTDLEVSRVHAELVPTEMASDRHRPDGETLRREVQDDVGYAPSFPSVVHHGIAACEGSERPINAGVGVFPNSRLQPSEKFASASGYLVHLGPPYRSGHGPGTFARRRVLSILETAADVCLDNGGASDVTWRVISRKREL